MARRVILGQRGAGEFGIWVSRPGQDATTDPRPLLATNAVALQVLLAGEVLITQYNAATPVSFGQTFSFVPVVLFCTYRDNHNTGSTYGSYVGDQGSWPFLQGYSAFVARQPLDGWCEVFSDRVDCFADSGYTFRYTVTKTPRVA